MLHRRLPGAEGTSLVQRLGECNGNSEMLHTVGNGIWVPYYFGMARLVDGCRSRRIVVTLVVRGIDNRLRRFGRLLTAAVGVALILKLCPSGKVNVLELLETPGLIVESFLVGVGHCSPGVAFLLQHGDSRHNGLSGVASGEGWERHCMNED